LLFIKTGRGSAVGFNFRRSETQSMQEWKRVIQFKYTHFDGADAILLAEQTYYCNSDK
jgi:hypothetical protein